VFFEVDGSNGNMLLEKDGAGDLVFTINHDDSGTVGVRVTPDWTDSFGVAIT